MKLFMEKCLQEIQKQAENDNIKRYVVGAVIANNDKVLTLKRASNDFMPDIYELPSGRVEAKESLSDALIREVKEETNLNITLSDICDYLGHFDYVSKSGTQTRQFNFLVHYDNSTPVILNPKEHEGYAWLRRNETHTYNISAEVNKILTVYFLRKNMTISTTQLIRTSQEEGITQFIASALVEINGSKVLLLKATNNNIENTHEIPSRKISYPETLELCLFNEIKQVTDLEVTVISSFLGHFDHVDQNLEKTRQFIFTVNVDTTKALRIGQSYEGYSWVSHNELSKYSLKKEVFDIISKFFSTQQNTKNISTSNFFRNKTKRKEEDITPDISGNNDTFSSLKKQNTSISESNSN